MNENHMMKPIFYSFRRCPYAMRARMALAISKQPVEHREIVLNNKPAEMLAISPKGTVPVLEILSQKTVLEESLDIMLWSLGINDPEDWLAPPNMPTNAVVDFVNSFDQEFKPHLDRYKYPTRYEDVDPKRHREAAIDYLLAFDEKIASSGQLCGPNRSLADIATFPFIRQFANVDNDWFAATELKALQKWLHDHVNSNLFKHVMTKYPLWVSPSKH